MNIESVYVIYSADIIGSENEINAMGPLRQPTREAPYAEPFPGAWTQTEGDEQYDYGYLGNETNDARYFPAGAFDSEAHETIDNLDDNDPRQDSTDYGEGRHRKWVAELSLKDWRTAASMLCIDLDDYGMPEQYEETMGSITEYGHLPAVAVDNTEGWTPISVISSSLYVSFATSESEES